MRLFGWVNAANLSAVTKQLQNSVWLCGICFGRTWGIAILKREKREEE